jgi:hypothetical protein
LNSRLHPGCFPIYVAKSIVPKLIEYTIEYPTRCHIRARNFYEPETQSDWGYHCGLKHTASEGNYMVVAPFYHSQSSMGPHCIVWKDRHGVQQVIVCGTEFFFGVYLISSPFSTLSVFFTLAVLWWQYFRTPCGTTNGREDGGHTPDEYGGLCLSICLFAIPRVERRRGG